MRNNSYVASADSPASVNVGAAYAELMSSATRSISVRSISITTKTGAGAVVALARSYAIGTGSAAGIATGLPFRTPLPATDAKLQTAWTSQPTGQTPKLRSEVLPAATGTARVLWSYDDPPLALEPNTSLLLVNGGSGIAGGPLGINVCWEEYPV